MSSLTNSNSRSNPDIALGLRDNNNSHGGSTQILDLEPNPFEQSFARTDDVIPSSTNNTNFHNTLNNKNLMNLSSEKPLTKPQSDTQLNNLRHNYNQQTIIDNLSHNSNNTNDIQPHTHKSDTVLVLSTTNNQNNIPIQDKTINNQQLQQQLNVDDPLNVDPNQLNGIPQIKIDNQISNNNNSNNNNNNNKNNNNSLQIQSNSITNGNVQNKFIQPPVLTPGGSKRGTSSVLPPLPGIISPGGGSFIATPGIWNALFPQTPGINNNSSNPNNNTNLPNLGQLSPNTLNTAQQQLQQQQQQNNKTFDTLQKQIQQIQAHQNQQGEQVRQQQQHHHHHHHQQQQQQQHQQHQQQQQQTQFPNNDMRNQAEQHAEKQLQQAQMQLQQAQLQAQLQAQVLAQVQQQVQQQNQNQNQTQNPTQTQQPPSINDTSKMKISVPPPHPKDQQMYNFLINAKRSGLTPNESSMRTGLTPGSNMTTNNPLYSYLSMTPGAITPLTSMLNSLNNSNNSNNNSNSSTMKIENGNTVSTNNTDPNIDLKKTLHTGLTDLVVPTLRTIEDNQGIINDNSIPNNMTSTITNESIPKITQQQILDSSRMIHNHKDSVDSSIVSNSTANTPGLIMKPINNQVFQDTDKNTITNGTNGKKRSNKSINGSNKGAKSKKSKSDKENSPTSSTSSGAASISASSPTSSPQAQAQIQTQAQPPSAPTPKPKRRKNLTEEEKRQNFLERNRVAASKCRQRKKEMVSTMKKELDNYKDENKSLREQVGMLREHALTLRTILFAHRDCSYLVEQVGGLQNLNTVLNATNYVSQISEAHDQPQSIKVEEVQHLLNNSSTNVQVAVAAAVAHTTNKAIERQEEHRLSH